ncbi:MAG: porin family protein [Gammaproteobacteria bacterium]|nr:porin family protein [Gammaproteobacteria bacterium]
MLSLLLLACSANVRAQAETGFIFEFDFSKAFFEEEVFGGDTAHLGLTLAYGLNPDYEIGLSISDNFLFNASLDRGPELGNAEDLLTNSTLLYLRRNWRISDNTTPFIMLGYAQVELKSERISACLLFCGDLIVTSTHTTYRSKDSGYAWGLGIQRNMRDNKAWSLRYVDYTSSDFEFTGVHLGFRTTLG